MDLTGLETISILLLLLPLVFYFQFLMLLCVTLCQVSFFQVSLSPAAAVEELLPLSSLLVGPFFFFFCVCPPLHWTLVPHCCCRVYINGKEWERERDTVTVVKYKKKGWKFISRTFFSVLFFFLGLFSLSISGKSPSFYLYTTPVIGLGAI